ncbi:MAG: ribonuclease HII [Candidatus ainarchaeum sp.]|nr:ribonuclease HII [Candidatus ainarchaeum sp.]
MVVISGVDEAGRGCVLGPMVLSICSIEESKEDFFRQKGVTDSKLIPKKKRENLFEIIKKEAVEYKISVIPAAELNILMNNYSLNEIEAIKTAEMISSLKKQTSKVILDSPDISENMYKLRIISNLKKIKFDFDENKIISEHKADLNYICAGCASIIAKVTRDFLLNKLIGSNLSGYSSDPKTIEYIKNYILENKKLPDFARTKWKTIDNIFKDLYQKKIGWFNEKDK